MVEPDRRRRSTPRTRRGLVHRDVKPANVLARAGRHERDERAYLARLRPGQADPRDRRRASRRTGHVVGTVDYLAPEQITSGDADARSDVYALGCLLVELLSGTAPFQPRRPTSRRSLGARPRPAAAPRRQRPGPGGGSIAVVRRALAKRPDERYASAGALARAATDAASQTSETVRGSSETRPRRRRAIAGAAVAGGALLAAAVAVALLVADDGSDDPGAAGTAQGGATSVSEAAPVDAASPADSSAEPPKSAATRRDASAGGSWRAVEWRREHAGCTAGRRGRGDRAWPHAARGRQRGRRDLAGNHRG